MQHGWTLEKQKWDNLLINIGKTHWSKVQFNQLYQDLVPETPGVYAICARLRGFNQSLFTALYEIIYVGRSKDSLRNRFLTHCCRPERGVEQAKQCFDDRLEYWFTEADSDQVANLETCLIECFGPPANRISGTIRAKIGDPQPA